MRRNVDHRYDTSRHLDGSGRWGVGVALTGLAAQSGGGCGRADWAGGRHRSHMTAQQRVTPARPCDDGHRALQSADLVKSAVSLTVADHCLMTLSYPGRQLIFKVLIVQIECSYSCLCCNFVTKRNAKTWQ